MMALQDRMRKAGFRRARWQCAEPRPESGWPALTQAETRVARLIGSGYTNKAASEALGISVNTTGTHLRSVFTKLGVVPGFSSPTSCTRRTRLSISEIVSPAARPDLAHVQPARRATPDRAHPAASPIHVVQPGQLPWCPDPSSCARREMRP